MALEERDKMIAMCWKCHNRIMDEFYDPVVKSTCMILVGCKEEPRIKDYNDTYELCPCLIEVRKNGG